LERDFDAVKNLIKYDYNNGLAEGSINKLKIIKRIMYGRCSFETLRIKTLRLEKMRNSANSGKSHFYLTTNRLHTLHSKKLLFSTSFLLISLLLPFIDLQLFRWYLLPYGE